ncbi:ModD protein [Rhodoferax sp.]|uniref:ModD protein n=1 Tax=Rhodoferax sp. TaxID=50421 RepID=UPI002844B53D|nr:ModD protein [Rhodoferax sp.]MDR3369518.1 ModD protein [Rhodoferax sp.]
MHTSNDAYLQSLLHDDAPHGDLTTHTLGIGPQAAQLTFRARQPMTVCATEEACRLFELAGAHALLVVPSSTSVAAGDVLLQAQGTAASLHRAWKVAQTLVEWTSGIATATAAIVAAANGVAVACTRKNTPGTKALSVKAVKAGGGIMHRLGLSESMLVFAEHRLFLNASPADTLQRLRQAQPEKKLAVEVADVAEAVLWAQAGADVLQLEKFTPDAVAACRQALRDSPTTPHPLLAAAGGIRADNAAAYVAAGADFLVTSSPYWAPPKDVQVTFRTAP